MTWHGQINRTIWEIENLLKQRPRDFSLRRELLRTHFLQRYEFDRSFHVPRDDRSFLFLQEERAPAFLLLHGAMGTPAEMRDLGNFLYSRGFTVFCPRLSRYDAKNRMVTWESWVTMAQSALDTTLEYSNRTAIAGLSLGATVALILSSIEPKVVAMALLAPAVYARLTPTRYLQVVARRLTPTLFFRFAGWKGESVKAMERVRHTITKIETPTLVVQAQDDHLIASKGVKFLSKRFAHDISEAVLLPTGSHALTRGPAKDDVFERIYTFTQRIELTRVRGGGVDVVGQPGEPQSEEIKHDDRRIQPGRRGGPRDGERRDDGERRGGRSDGRRRGRRGGRRGGGRRGDGQRSETGQAGTRETGGRGERRRAEPGESGAQTREARGAEPRQSEGPNGERQRGRRRRRGGRRRGGQRGEHRNEDRDAARTEQRRNEDRDAARTEQRRNEDRDTARTEDRANEDKDAARRELRRNEDRDTPRTEDHGRSDDAEKSGRDEERGIDAGESRGPNRRYEN